MKPIAYVLLGEHRLSNCVCLDCATPFIETFAYVQPLYLFPRADIWCTVCLNDIERRIEIERVV